MNADSRRPGPPRVPVRRVERPFLQERAAPTAAPERVLLLHGLASTTAVWDGFAAAADPAYELWTAELPWAIGDDTGWSAEPASHWVERAVAEVPGGPHTVMAHSFGAAALLEWLTGPSPAARGVRSAVLVSPFYRARREDFDWAAMTFYLDNFHRILEDGLRVSSGGRLDPELRREMALKVRELVGPYGWTRFFQTYLGAPRWAVADLRLPVLLIAGALDEAVPPAEAEVLGRELPDAEVCVLPGVGHFTMVERAAEFADAVHRFLRGVAARPGRPAAAVEPPEGPSR